MTADQSWFQRLNRREKTLLVLVSSVVFALFNFLFFRFALDNSHRLQTALNTRTAEWKIARQLLTEADLWEARTKWLAEHQPKAPSDAETNRAHVELMNQLKDAASATGVQLQDAEPLPVESTESHLAVSISVRTSSSWEALLKFLYAVQQPDSFIVVESSGLETEPKDAKQMQGRFKISRWFAPRHGS